jgi:hypothetical protein
MTDRQKFIYNLTVGVVCLAAFVALFLILKCMLLGAKDSEIKLTLLVIVGVMSLFATLALVAVTFSVAGLSDPTQALGLPEGSVRAAIAMSLIVIFSILSIYLYSSILNPTIQSTGNSTDTSLTAADRQKAATDFGKQVFAVVGTLMTSVASFYFASRTSAGQTGTAAKSSPQLVSVDPSAAPSGATSVDITVAGTELQLAKSVKIQQTGGGAVMGTNVRSNDASVTCTLAIAATLPRGAYDVVVTNSDGGEDTLSNAFTV